MGKTDNKVAVSLSDLRPRHVNLLTHDDKKKSQVSSDIGNGAAIEDTVERFMESFNAGRQLQKQLLEYANTPDTAENRETWKEIISMFPRDQAVQEAVAEAIITRRCEKLYSEGQELWPAQCQTFLWVTANRHMPETHQKAKQLIGGDEEKRLAQAHFDDSLMTALKPLYQSFWFATFAHHQYMNHLLKEDPGYDVCRDHLRESEFSALPNVLAEHFKS